MVMDIANHLLSNPSFSPHIAAGPLPPHEISLTHILFDKGIPLKEVPGMGNHIDPLLGLKAFLRLRSIIADGRYDIVHTHSSVAGVLGRMAAASMKVPVIIHHVHGWGLQEGMSKALQSTYVGLERLCAKYTTRMIAVSEPTLQKGLQLNICPEGKFKLIYNGISLDRFRKKHDREQICIELGLNPSCKIVGMVGRLDKQKNPLDFIKASALVAQQYANVQFIIVGDGALRNDCECLIRTLNIGDRIRLVGYRSDVERMYNIMSVFALSSLWEGLPIVFQEAMTAGKPIVANDVDGASDVVHEGETGYLVAPHHPEEMAERILTLLQHEDQCRRMGEKARKYAECFSVNVMTRSIEMLYRELLADAVADSLVPSREEVLSTLPLAGTAKDTALSSRNRLRRTHTHVRRLQAHR